LNPVADLQDFEIYVSQDAGVEKSQEGVSWGEVPAKPPDGP
jgi:hypothetical protein